MSAQHSMLQQCPVCRLKIERRYAECPNCGTACDRNSTNDQTEEGPILPSAQRRSNPQNGHRLFIGLAIIVVTLGALATGTNALWKRHVERQKAELDKLAFGLQLAVGLQAGAMRARIYQIDWYFKMLDNDSQFHIHDAKNIRDRADELTELRVAAKEVQDAIESALLTCQLASREDTKGRKQELLEIARREAEDADRLYKQALTQFRRDEVRAEHYRRSQ